MLTRWNPFDEVFNFQREVDRLFNQFWSDLPTRTAQGSWPSFQVNAEQDGWRIDVPLPGIDPQNVILEVAGSVLAIRVVEQGDQKNASTSRFEQTIALPQFLDLDRIQASHRHGMLRLTLPLKDSVKPRRVAIDVTSSPDQKQLSAAA